MDKHKTANFSHGLLWFGAAVSIAEILTGALIAPLGLLKGLTAILLGHLIGCAVFYFAGYIGAESKLPALESTRISFGRRGSYLFSLLNMLQLLGWTAVMLIVAAKAMDAVTTSVFDYSNPALYCVFIGLLIALWIIMGLKNLSKLNNLAVIVLFIFTVVLSVTVFKGAPPPAGAGTGAGAISFGSAVELAAIMPLSWLPLVSDYTRYLKKKKSGVLASTLGYFFGSSWMYAIGLGGAIYAGTADVAVIMMKAGLGLAALLIVILSTVTTTFLDAYSAGVSFVNISKAVSEKAAALAICALGVLLAVFFNMEKYVDFLYLIGSAFAPLYAILLTDYFLFKIKAIDAASTLNIPNILIWAAGFTMYRLLLPYNSPVGVTLPVMAAIALLCIIIYGGKKLCSKRSWKTSGLKRP